MDYVYAQDAFSKHIFKKIALRVLVFVLFHLLINQYTIKIGVNVHLPPSFA